MMKKLLLLIFMSATLAHGQSRPDFNITRAEKPPVIDGNLNDDAWKVDPLPTTDWLSYDPLYGQKQAQKTEVRVTYDDRYL